jgi:hypothetical protein
MPIYHHFYVECLDSSGWGVPRNFVAEDWTFKGGRPFGEFAWAHPRSGWLALFWGRDALFPMRPGPPDNRHGSPLLRHLDEFYDYRCNEDGLCWLPYAELFIDTWDMDTVLVATEVPARLALLFGNGTGQFPGAELLASGVTPSESDRLRSGQLSCAPVDVTFGAARFRVAILPEDREVKVTWRETIAEFVGEPHARLFKGLRQYGWDDDLRIISKRG